MVPKIKPYERDGRKALPKLAVSFIIITAFVLDIVESLANQSARM